jgi:hypothetical protein
MKHVCAAAAMLESCNSGKEQDPPFVLLDHSLPKQVAEIGHSPASFLVQEPIQRRSKNPSCTGAMLLSVRSRP